MKKSVILLLVLAMVGSALAAPAFAGKKKKNKKPTRVERTAEGSYAAPATAVGNCTQVDGVGCMTFPSGSDEEYITAKVTDATGQPVFVSVQADLDGDISSETTYGTFCGETTEPIKVDPGVELIFWVSPATSADRAGCAPGQGTQGTIEVTFSNLP